MRPSVRALLLAAVALTLSGCTAPSGGDDGGFEISCPAWVHLPHNAQIVDGTLLMTNQTMAPDLTRWDFKEPGQTPGQGIGEGNLETYKGRPLDQMVFDFRMRERDGSKAAQLLYVQDAELRLRFHASDGGYPGERLQAYDEALGRSSLRDEWVFRADPRLHYGIFNVTLRLELADSGEEPAPRGVFLEWEMVPDLDRDIDTPSIARMRYAPQYLYRTCSDDGTRFD